ncbi:hypothetical protein TRV_00008 [Trichophyton verrucosum HKI 0517]|uniref:Uncharacterized protein n=1 Tax=Trichophyton verrucosum (strain HKI 0517) TaxID=663202 RepID=D4CYX1_TRIVH|nr:uncharacterized protein TRV_00008 [Trichophyton verrucosum HKI 0517]EFE45194.1 hypothetical protein TRV_00008 [Trichophyton verrucosum HKI 0517]
MSSASPPKEPEVEPVTQSGDEAEPMEREHHDIQTQGQGEFEVKEQDRWLPIANGLFIPFSLLALLLSIPSSSFVEVTHLPYLTTFSSLNSFRTQKKPRLARKKDTPKGLDTNTSRRQYTNSLLSSPKSLLQGKDSLMSMLSPPLLPKASYMRIQSISLKLMRCNLESGCSLVQSPKTSISPMLLLPHVYQ